MAAAGQLIALEGTQGPALEEGAQRLLKHFSRGKSGGGISRWDASNTFYELRLGKAKALHPSARTLVLLYAYDLLFRLRWEIQPALESGLCVVAAPYVESAVAFGEAAGLEPGWLAELFRFAPKPTASFRLKERKKGLGKKAKPSEGFIEFCCAVLRKSYPDFDTGGVRKRSIRHLADLKGSKKLSKKL